MRSLAFLVVVFVLGFAGVAVWLAVDRGAPAPADAPASTAASTVVTLPSGPEARRRPGPAKAGTPKSAYLDPALVEDGRWGPLPKVGPKGRKPSRAYARPFRNPAGRPRIAILVTGLGLKADLTEAAIKGLPGPVTLAFSAYAPSLYGWTEQARAAGHETLVELPMAARAPARSDAGPKALRAGLAPDRNRDRLHWALSRFAGYVGVIGARGEALSRQTAAFAPLLDEMLARGLLYVQPRPGAAPETRRGGVLHVDLWLDTTLDPDAIDRRMRLAEALARGRGWVVAAVGAYPITVDAVRRWAQVLGDRDLIAAPLTAAAPAAK